uniref:Uncharacterized protein n=1 Tax=Anguilla anguilla TaxID=7936 RepID=A0A0E9XNT9_ANGAN
MNPKLVPIQFKYIFTTNVYSHLCDKHARSCTTPLGCDPQVHLPGVLKRISKIKITSHRGKA